MYPAFLYRKHRSKLVLLLLLCATTLPVFAEGPRQPSSLSNPFVTLMVIVIASLAIIIGIMAKVVTSAAAIYFEKEKKEEQAEAASIAPKVIGVLALMFCATSVFAQDKAPAVVTAGGLNGISDTAYYILCSVVAIELIIIAVLLYMLRVFTGVQKARVAKAIIDKPVVNRYKQLWNKLNSFRPVTDEASIELDHNYDGIRELDNRLPPWWLYGFYATIVFSFVYLYMHHVSHSAPDPIAEYQAEVAKADIAKEAYLKKAANNVDETTVALLTDEASVNAGKAIFQSTCWACHGKLGEGGVGPNLTDDYWLHGGSIQDVFKTIKYGWPDKGMKSWKDDFSPVQIAQIASYVKSLHGSNPTNAKPAQGTLFTDAAANTKDSTKVTKKI